MEYVRYKIGLVLPYFGRLPNYFKFFLKSCETNPTIDFLLFTDQEIVDSFKNVHVIEMSFEDFKDELQQAFPFPLTHLRTPYNLCDFKPAYGYALKKYLSEYDYWGHCDCDLIWGDLRAFITDEILDKYDRIFTRGHLTIYRNNTAANTMFMSRCDAVPFYEDVYRSSHRIVWAFDEWNGTSLIWRRLRSDRVYDGIVYDDLVCGKKEFISSQRRRFNIEPSKKIGCYCKRENKLFRCGWDIIDDTYFEAETLYAHFQKRSFKIFTSDSDEYLIIPNNFIPIENVTLDKVRYWGRKRLFYQDAFKRRVRNVFKRIFSALTR